MGEAHLVSDREDPNVLDTTNHGKDGGIQQMDGSCRLSSNENHSKNTSFSWLNMLTIREQKVSNTTP